MMNPVTCPAVACHPHLQSSVCHPEQNLCPLALINPICCPLHACTRFLYTGLLPAASKHELLVQVRLLACGGLCMYIGVHRHA